MRCKRHPRDLSSSVGVCASCLRERLSALIAAQEERNARLSEFCSLAVGDHRRGRPADHQPLVFPRSVSPYVARRKSDHGGRCDDDDGGSWSSNHHLFYSTPQVGPSAVRSEFSAERSFKKKKKKGRLSILSRLFRSRSEKLDPASEDSDPRVSCRDSCEPSSSSPSSSWLSTIFTPRRKNKPAVCYIEDAVAIERGRRRRAAGRGMSPAIGPDSDEELEPPASTEISPARWKRTPTAAARRAVRSVQPRNMSGLYFCLSPLVRASPDRRWSHKSGLPPDLAYSGEIRAPAKPHLSTAASFCANRSRKLADFGRVSHNR